MEQQLEQKDNQPNENKKIIPAIIIVAITIIVIMVFLTVDFSSDPDPEPEVRPSLTSQERGNMIGEMLGEDFSGSSPQERLESTNVTNRTNPQKRLDMFNN